MGELSSSDADITVYINDWENAAHTRAQIDKAAHQHPDLRKSLANGKVAFSSGWSPQAESSLWAKSVQQAGFIWDGANPEVMARLNKINYKELALTLGLPTAAFQKIAVPEGITDQEETLKIMAQTIVTLYHNSPELAGNPVYAKHNEGGGGRGTKKIVTMTFESALEAVKQIIAETGGNLNGVYIEKALDLKGTQLFQMEIEWVGKRLAKGARFVYFNDNNQKSLEIGYLDEAICKLIPKEVYDACRAVSQTIFEASGYDNRGTNEILLTKSVDNKEPKDKWSFQDAQGNWWLFKLLELNQRPQVEHSALSHLYIDDHGEPINVFALQILTALGLPIPPDAAYREKGPKMMAHLRLGPSRITSQGTEFDNGVALDGAFCPPNADVLLALGRTNIKTDGQHGRALIAADTMAELCDNGLKFTQDYQSYGPNTHLATLMDYYRKLFSSPKLRDGTMGCNEAIHARANAPVTEGKNPPLIRALANVVTPLVLHGFAAKDRVKNQHPPAEEYIAVFKDYKDKLRFETPPQTPFSRLIIHHNLETYYQEIRDQLYNQGGGSITVTRDVFQEEYASKSALFQTTLARITEIFFARAGGMGFEIGGAQYQVAEMDNIDSMSVLLAGCLSNLMSFSLTRSGWMNGLDLKSLAEIDFILATYAAEVAGLYGLDPKILVPLTMNNFHAGNHWKQDQVTGLILDHNIQVTPNLAWDPRLTEAQFEDWLTRQMILFAQKGKPLHQLRIKNPGQGPAWNAEVIMRLVGTIRRLFQERGLTPPIILVHNHDFRGTGAHIAADVLRQCQILGHPWIIFDSVPHGFTTHNSNKLIFEALHKTKEQRDNLAEYNRQVHATFRLAHQFCNREISLGIKTPYSQMAGGTHSSDLSDATKMGIPPHRIAPAIELARKLFGLGTPVTPYSQIIQRVGYAIETNEDIQPKTEEAVIAYVESGKKLDLSADTLSVLEKWETVLPQPDITKQLLRNHGRSPEFTEKDLPVEVPFDIEAKRAALQAKLPKTLVTNRVLAGVVAFGKIGEESAIRRESNDMTWLLESPEFVFNPNIKKGDSFLLGGEVVSVVNMTADPSRGTRQIDYLFQGRIIRTSGIDPKLQQAASIPQVRLVENDATEFGPTSPGEVTEISVKIGDRVTEGQALIHLEAMKMVRAIGAARRFHGLFVKKIEPVEKKVVERNQLIITFEPGPDGVVPIVDSESPKPGM